MIDIICPSRGRPENLMRLWNTCDHARVRIHTYIDDDDPKRDEYRLVTPAIYGIMMYGERIRLVPAYNKLAQRVVQVYPDCSIIAFFGDDHVPRTPDWETRIEQAMEPMGVVYCNDLIMGEALPTAAFLDAEIVRRLGYLAPPGLIHMYGDNFWRLIGETTGKLRYLEDVVIEHMHPLRTGSWDETTAQANAPDVWANDTPVWETYLAEYWPTEKEKLL